eukprot:SAG22_NODE_2140_length_2952_cov_2.317210_2_plen_187_part_00
MFAVGGLDLTVRNAMQCPHAGWVNPFLNGAEVAIHDRLNPGRTSFDMRQWYMAHDVTAAIKPGARRQFLSSQCLLLWSPPFLGRCISLPFVFLRRCFHRCPPSRRRTVRCRRSSGAKNAVGVLLGVGWQSMGGHTPAARLLLSIRDTAGKATYVKTGSDWAGSRCVVLDLSGTAALDTSPPLCLAC